MLATARFDLSLLDSLIPRRAVLDLSELGCKVIVVDIEGRQIRSILLSTDGEDKRQEVSLDGRKPRRTEACNGLPRTTPLLCLA